MNPSDVVAFWTNAGPKAWFAKDDAFDQAIRARFEALHHRAARRELDDWAQGPEGSLALLLLLDQFPRNLYRRTAHAYATDPLARRVAEAAVDAGHDLAMPAALRPFFYLPFEHSESSDDQARGLALVEAHARETGDHDTLRWARIHAAIVARFGRLPHRNPALGRQDTPEEAQFLETGGFAG